jgi:hypothetical protein
MNSQSTTRPSRDHVFYLALSAALACVVVVGFSRTHFLKGLFGTTSLSPLFHVHGTAFAAWTVFYIIQNVLVFVGRTDLHRRAGMIGAVLACPLVLLGVLVAITAAKNGYRAHRPDMAIELSNALMTLTLFSSFLGAAIHWRRRKKVHKRLMVLSMVMVVFPAFARIPPSFPSLSWTLPRLTMVILPFIFAGLIYDGIALRRVSPTYVWGVLAILISLPLRFAIASTEWWNRFFLWVVA